MYKIIIKHNKARLRIYIRTFIALFSIYLVLMIGFSIFLVEQEKKSESIQISSYAEFVNENLETILNNKGDIKNKTSDLSKVKKQFVNKLGINSYLGSEIALYTGQYDLIAHSNDYWVCCYTEYTEGNKNYSGYAYLNQHEWLSEKEIEELEGYLYAKPKAEKAGDLYEYIINLEGFWLDNEMIIPHKIIVIPMYASTFDENGEPNSGSSTRTEKIYINEYQNPKNLPYYEFASMNPSKTYHINTQSQNKLREQVTDKNKLTEAVRDSQFKVSFKRDNLFSYGFYLVHPYKNHVKMTEDKKNYSDYWTVFAGKIDFFEKCKNTLGFVWVSCLIIFMVVSLVLSAQTYKAYKKRKEFERQRSYITNSLAHDLKTPLSIISGYAENLFENIHSEKREYYAGNILTNVSRMDGIIRKMLDLLKVESDYLEVDLEEVSLDVISSEIINRYKAVSEDKKITVSLVGNVIVKADKFLIERVIDNFFINALDNTPEGGSISISLNDNTLKVFNSNSNIPKECLDEIWLPHKKGDASRGNSKGTGLGLAITKTILELHKFRYGVKNTEDGVCFWIKFS